ncbi:hypothetical protein [Colwellia sp. MEBiC06753]
MNLNVLTRHLLTILFILFYCQSNNSFAANAPQLTVYDISPAKYPTLYYAHELALYDEQLFFSANDLGLGAELWSINLGNHEQQLAQDINLGIESSDPKGFTVYQDKLYFNAYTKAHGRELWVYDKSMKNAALVSDLVIGKDTYGNNLSANPIELTVFNDKLYFFIEGTDVNSFQLWFYDGSTNQSVRVGTFEVNALQDDHKRITPKLIKFTLG